MTFRERMEKRFGSPLPGYIERVVKMRERGQARREQAERDHKAKIEAERAREKALRRPPQNVRLVGRRVHWEPPETVNELPPAGYWISEERNGEWTRHGDFVLPHVRSAVLFGSHDGSAGPCYVETHYHQMALGEMYRSPIVHQE